MIDTSVIRERFTAVDRSLNEGSPAARGGRGQNGRLRRDCRVVRATGIARSTIGRGLKDLADPGSLSGRCAGPAAAGRH